MKKILMLHGPNHNMFGHRDENLYGVTTYEQINEMMVATAQQLGVELEIFQSNFEGEFINKVHQAYFNHVDAVIVNPGGWTNHSIAVKDALDILKVPRIEVHMSNTFRKHNGLVQGDTTKTATGVIIGFGAMSYTLALQAAVEMIQKT